MDTNKDVQYYTSNAGLSGFVTLAGFGVELLAHNPLVAVGGVAVAYLSWKYNGGEKVLAIKQQISQGGINAVLERRLAPKSNATLPDTENLGDIYAARGADVLAFGSNVETGLRFAPALDDLLGKGMLLAGSQGTGKSNIIGLVAQSAGRAGMPFLIIDFKGEFYPVCDVVPNGIVAGHPDAAYRFPGGYYALTSKTASDLAQILMEGPFQVVLDVPSYGGNNDEVAEIISTLLQSMMDWSRAIMRNGGEPWPCLVITDEAHNFLPERRTLSALVMQKPEASFGLLTKAYSGMANAGRSFGYTLLMATQRLPNIAKWSIGNLQTKVILAHAEKNDLDACELETGGQVDREVIKRLPQGTGIVTGFSPEPIMVRFDKQRAKHVSVTPKTERLRQQFAGAAAPSLSQMLAERTAYSHSQTTMRDTIKTSIPSTPRLPDLPMKECVNELVAPYRGHSQDVNIQDSVNDIREDIHEEDGPKYTPGEAAEVVKAYATLVKTAQPTTRSNMIAWMNKNVGSHWNTGAKSYRKFQAICEDMNF